MNKTKSRNTTLDIRRPESELFRDLLGRIPRKIALEVKGSWENCLIFTASLLRAQEQSIPIYRKSSKHGRVLVWINIEKLSDLKHRKEVHSR